LEFALLDGYGVGDRLLEGVKFEVRFVAVPGGLEVIEATTRAKDKSYMSDLNEAKWLKKIAEAAAEEDTLECPKCGRDIDGPDAMR
jgi:hypothetical protein